MTIPTVDAQRASDTLQVSGIIYHLVEYLEHPLLIQLWVDKRDVVSVLLKRGSKQEGVCLFRTPRRLPDQSVLTVRVEDRHRDGKKNILALLNLSLDILCPEPDNTSTHSRKHRILLEDPRKRIWLILDTFTLRSDPTDVGRNSYPPHERLGSPERLSWLLESASSSAVQRLRELQTTLDRLGGAKHPVELALKFETTISDMNVLSKAVLEYIRVVYEETNLWDPGRKDILQLSETMASTANHVQPVKDIVEWSDLRRPLEMFPELMQQTASCIEAWLKQYVLGDIVPSPSGKNGIGELNRRHTIFRTEFDQGIEIARMHTLNRSQDWGELKDRLLRGIKIVDARATECMPGTRTTILADISIKIDDRDSSNVIHIRGAPGSGKSSISLSTKSRLRTQGRLITYFRFDRNEPSTTTPAALWRFVAYDLACRFPSVRTQILQQLKDDTVNLDLPVDIFTSLIEGPLTKLTATIGDPLVIVIDAIDECGGLSGHLSQDRQMLLQTLRRWAELPRYFKLLVTSRDEGDISRVLPSTSVSIEIPSGDFLMTNPQAEASIHAANDIRIFLEHRFQTLRVRLPSLPKDWPGTVATDEMVHRAAGIFMWATAAANFIDGKGINPQDRLNRIMGHVPESKGMQPLYSLYITILDTAFGDIAEGDSEADSLKSVFGTMVLARRPLHDAEFTKVLAVKLVTEVMIDSVRDGLHSVIAPGTRLRFTHKSFDDFLLSKECPSKYRIQEEESQYLLADFCLSTMMEALHFNLCGLETSHLRNVDVPEIEIKVANCIPPLLVYSCCFLTDHLGVTSFDEHLMGQVKGVMWQKLLYWFEAMSLLKEVNRISHSLLLMLKWSHLSPDDEFKDFLHDARRFIGAFIHPISQSTPHIYLSALPFAPEYSFVAKRFHPRFPSTLALSTGKPDNWSSCIFTSEYHKDQVRSIAFSPDGKLFASGSVDRNIYVLDSETGNLFAGPFRGHDSVYYVFFDPDGRRIWAGYWDCEVVCWDIQTGDKHHVFRASECGKGYYHFRDSQEIIYATNAAIAVWSAETGSHELLRHTYVMEWVSMSPDGCHVALAAYFDTVVRIWSVMGGSTIEGPYQAPPRFKQSEPLTALSFSVEGSFVLSGSTDGTILIWDAKTGNVDGRPFDTGARVDAVAYSPARGLLLSSSGRTGAVMVWSASTREAILGPLKGHTSQILDIVISRNGHKALTGSVDGTVRMWDMCGAGVASSRVKEDTASPVLCIAFSRCGKRLASIDWQAIRIWDVDRPDQSPLTLDNKKYGYVKIVFSPSGSQVLAYGAWQSCTIRVWNADHGALTLHFDMRADNWRRISIDHASFRSTDQQLVTCFSNSTIRIWNFQNGTMTEDTSASSPQPEEDDEPVQIRALSPDGSTAVVCDNNRNPRHYLWSTITHQPVSLNFVDSDYMSGSGCPDAYSPNGQFFASARWHSDERVCRLRIWNTQTGEVIAHTSMHTTILQSIAFSPNNRYIAVAYITHGSDHPAIWIWDTRANHLSSGPWHGHRYRVSTLAFCPDGEKLVSGSRDHHVRVWNVADLIGDSQVSGGLFGGGEYLDDGWVRDAEGGSMFWVPNEHRASLVWPQSILFDSGGAPTKLDLSRFRYGCNWAACSMAEARIAE